MSPVPYSTMVKAKDKEFRFDIRLSMVKDAKRLGIRPTMRRWKCSRNTVRKWLRRYEAEGLQGLKERSHAPKTCPHKVDGKQAQKIIKLRKQSGFGAKRLKMEFDLSCGHNAINRLIRENGLTKKPKTKRQKKNDLRKVKAKLDAFQRVHMDIKYLTDIPAFLPQIRLRGLPSFQYTIRDVKTGLLFLSYGNSISKTLACVCVSRFLSHLRAFDVDLSKVTIQTDNGTEFDGQMISPTDRGFRHIIEAFKANHRFIPPGCSNANAEVESSHALIEREFYEREQSEDTDDFLAKAWAYQAYFNISRPNSYQNWRTPLERLEEAAPKLSGKIALLPPHFLDNLQSYYCATPKHREETRDEEILRNLTRPASRPPPAGQHQPGHPDISRKTSTQWDI